MREHNFTNPMRHDSAELPFGVLMPTGALPGGESYAQVLTTRQKTSEFLKWLFSFPAMLGMLLVASVAATQRMFEVDPDLWWHIKVGQDILATHRWPTTDPYSFSVMGHPWIAYEWLGDVLWAMVYRLGGLRGMDLLMIVVGSAVSLALYYYATLRSGNSKAGFLATVILIPLTRPSLSLRPQMLGYLFLVLTLIAMLRFREGKRTAAWFLPLLFLLWVNTHGSFIIGLGVVLLYLLAGLREFQFGELEAHRWSAKDRIQLESIFLLCLAVLPITPYGTRLAIYPLDMAFGQPLNVSVILEWQSMPFNLLGGKVFLGLILLFFLLQVVFHFRWRLEELALFLFGVMMACLHVRFILLFVPFVAPVLARAVARWMPPYRRAIDKFVINGALMAAAVACMVYCLPSEARIKQLVAKKFPAGAVEFLEHHAVPGPTFDTYGFGGYMVFSGKQVFIDGRGDLYEHGGVLNDYMQITTNKPGALAILDRYQVQSCVIEFDEPLATLLSASPKWKRVFVDGVSAIFVRQ